MSYFYFIKKEVDASLKANAYILKLRAGTDNRNSIYPVACNIFNSDALSLRRATNLLKR